MIYLGRTGAGGTGALGPLLAGGGGGTLNPFSTFFSITTSRSI